MVLAICTVLPSAPKAAAESDASDYPGNHCLSYDGVNQTVQFGYSQIFNLQKLTIEAWVKPRYNILIGSNSTYGHQVGTIAHHRPNDVYYYYHGWVLYFDYLEGCLYFAFCCNPYMTYHIYGFHANRAIWYNSSWYAVAVTFDPTLPNGNVKFYINGTFDSQHDESYGINTYVNAPMEIGVEFGFNGFNGLIDELRIWNQTRTGAEISSTVTRTLNSSEILNPNLVGYWRFDEGSGTITHDYSIQANDGVLGAGQSTAKPAWTLPGSPIVPEFSQFAWVMVLAVASTASVVLGLSRRKKKPDA
jgi:hypothetical protein